MHFFFVSSIFHFITRNVQITQENINDKRFFSGKCAHRYTIYIHSFSKSHLYEYKIIKNNIYFTSYLYSKFLNDRNDNASKEHETIIKCRNDGSVFGIHFIFQLFFFLIHGANAVLILMKGRKGILSRYTEWNVTNKTKKKKQREKQKKKKCILLSNYLNYLRIMFERWR